MDSSDILGVRIDACTLAEAVDFIAGLMRDGGCHQVVTANAEIVWRAWQEEAFAQVLAKASLVTADGVGVLWAARRLGQYLPEQVAGIDLARELARRGAAESWRFFLYGGAPGVAETVAARLKAEYPGLEIAGVAHGYQLGQGEELVREAIRASRPHILLVALGAPRQELWIARWKSTLGVPVSIGVGGSFDVLAGKVKRAPGWVRELKLEWLYRLVREPWRIRRQMALPAFAWSVLWSRRR